MGSKKTSLRNQLVAVICVVAFLPLFIYIWQLHKLKNGYQENIKKSFDKMKGINRNLIETGIYKLFSSIATDISDKVSIFFNIKEEELLDIAWIYSSMNFQDEIREKILYSKLNNSKDIMRLAFRTKEGRVSSYSKPDWMSSFRFNEIIKDDKIFGELSANEIERFVSDPYPSLQPPRQLLITIAIPMIDDYGRAVSVIYAEISLIEISYMVNDIALQMGSYSYGHNIDFFVVDGLGRMVFNPAKPEDALSQKDMTHLYVVGQHLLSKRMHGTVTYYENNNPILGAYYPIKDLNWGLIIREPKINATKALYKVGEETEKALIQTENLFRLLYLNVLLWICVIIIIAFFLAIRFSNYITAPLFKLIDLSLTIAKGDFSKRLSIKANNEIHQLCDTFNYMIEQLQIRDREKKEFLFGTVKCLAKAIDSRDPYTGEHSMRVADHAHAIAEEMGLSKDELENVRMAALLHDVGKIKIADDILQNKGKVTDKDYEILKKHPIFGADIMAENKYLKDITPGIATHHESFAGGGYPKGLKYEEIPLIGRIIRVADTFDAITSNRPYQKAYADEYAIEYIEGKKGIEFDPAVVEAFLKAYKKGKIFSLNRTKELCEVDTKGET